MALTEPYYSLKNVEITFQGGAVAEATEIVIKRKLELADKTPGSSPTQVQVIVKEMMPEITIKGWNTGTLSIADLTPRTAISAFTVLSTEESTPSVLWSDFFTKWPIAKMAIGDTDTSLGEKPSEWHTQILCGIANPT